MQKSVPGPIRVDRVKGKTMEEEKNELNACPNCPEPAPEEETAASECAECAEPAAEEETAASECAECAEEGKSNLTICPNCLEPNPDDLAVCKFCGQPLHPGAEPVELDGENADGLTSPEEQAENRADAVPAEEKKEEPKKNNFDSIMPFLGLYVLYMAYETYSQLKAQLADPETAATVNSKLGYLTVGIYVVAGLLLMRSWFFKLLEMIRGPKAKDESAAEEPASEEVPAEENAVEEAPVEEPVEESAPAEASEPTEEAEDGGHKEEE